MKFLQETTKPLSCVSGNAMIEFGTGNAPVLDYEIPQKTSFSAYGTNEITPLFASETPLTEEDIFMLKAFEEPVLPPVSVPANTAGVATVLTYGGVGGPIINTTQPTLPRPKTPRPPRTLDSGLSLEMNKTMNQTVEANETYNGLPSADFFAQQITQGNYVLIEDAFGGFLPTFTIVPRPNAGSLRPIFFLVEEYLVASFLGNYGAGKTLNTFTLLPSEKTSITIRTYKESTETKKRAENVMDSFSEDSAKEFENTLEKESSTKTAENKTNSISASVSLKIPFVKGSAKIDASRSVTKSREANTRDLAKSIEKHANKTNSSRKVEVSSSSENSQKEGEEITTVRNLVNPNQSRVLNFVFRQLLQEYVTIMYLSNVKIGFTNGHPESQVIVPIEKLDELLATYVKPAFIDEMRDQIIFEYLTVTNYQGFNQAFLEKVVKPTYSPNGKNTTVEFYTKNKALKDSYELELGNGTRTIKVEGIILSVEKNTLFTDSVIVDSLLGQGEALDCFNAKMQDSVAQKADLENGLLQEAISVLQKLDDPALKVELLKALLGKNTKETEGGQN